MWGKPDERNHRVANIITSSALIIIASAIVRYVLVFGSIACLSSASVPYGTILVGTAHFMA